MPLELFLTIGFTSNCFLFCLGLSWWHNKSFRQPFARSCINLCLNPFNARGMLWRPLEWARDSWTTRSRKTWHAFLFFNNVTLQFLLSLECFIFSWTHNIFWCCIPLLTKGLCWSMVIYKQPKKTRCKPVCVQLAARSYSAVAWISI